MSEELNRFSKIGSNGGFVAALLLRVEAFEGA